MTLRTTIVEATMWDLFISMKERKFPLNGMQKAIIYIYKFLPSKSQSRVTSASHGILYSFLLFYFAYFHRTNQHGCGNEWNHCQLVMQYMCASDLRDGTTTNTIPDTPSNCVDNNCSGDVRYGMHEDYGLLLGVLRWALSSFHASCHYIYIYIFLSSFLFLVLLFVSTLSIP